MITDDKITEIFSATDEFSKKFDDLSRTGAKNRILEEFPLNSATIPLEFLQNSLSFLPYRY